MMSTDRFKLLGHDNPLGFYPAPVVPVGRIDGDLVAICATKGWPDVVKLKGDAHFVRYNEGLINNLRGFDYLYHRLFAMSNNVVNYYPIKRESEVFLSLLRQRFFSKDNPFFRLSLAKITDSVDVIIKELTNCVLRLHKSTPEFVDSWYEAQLQTLYEYLSPENYSVLPKQWRDLPYIKSSRVGFLSGSSGQNQTDSVSDFKQSFGPALGMAVGRVMVVSALFRDRVSLEQAYQSAYERGYRASEINILMTEETCRKFFLPQTSNSGLQRVYDDVDETWWTENDTPNTELAMAISYGTSVTLPEYRLFISGPITTWLVESRLETNNESKSILTNILVSSGIPNRLVREYESGIKRGRILMLMNPHTKDDADHVSTEWQDDLGENIYQ